ncbi:telethonin [Polyodon spathula]|uniref:telethonin n=1 Tax=Polyodon spathula TaxID=7913 RepID=UPI001B7DE237|nr:telethonin [Polyodon spathula]
MHSSAPKGTSHLFNAHCEVKEDNLKDKELYHSSWQDLVMETRPWEKTTLSENNTQKKETYEKKHLDIFLVQRSPDQKMKMGRLGERMTEYQLPYRNVLPVPIFMPSKVMSVAKDLTRAPTPAELKAIMEFEKALSKGVSVGRREISEITKEMPKVIQPIRMDFRASNLVAPRNVLPQFEAVLRS